MYVILLQHIQSTKEILQHCDKWDSILWTLITMKGVG